MENFMDSGAWQATVHGVTESDTTEPLSLSQTTLTLHFLIQKIELISESVSHSLVTDSL